MADETINIAFNIDESDATASLNNIANDLDKIEKEANSTQSSLNSTFNTTRIKQYERETNKAAASTSRLDASVKRTTRSQSRRVRATNAATSALARYAGVNSRAIGGARGFSTALAATPWGLAIAGATALVTGLEFLGVEIFNTTNELDELSEATKKLNQETQKLNEENEKLAERNIIERLKLQGATIEEVTEATNKGLLATREANRQQILDLEDQRSNLLTEIQEIEAVTIETSRGITGVLAEAQAERLKNLRAQLAQAEALQENFNQKNIAINNQINASENDLEANRRKRFEDRKKRRDKEAEQRRKQEEKLAAELLKIQEKIFKEELKVRLESITDAQEKEIEARTQAADEQEKNVRGLFERQKEILNEQATEEERSTEEFNNKLAMLDQQLADLLLKIEQDKNSDIIDIRAKFFNERQDKAEEQAQKESDAAFTAAQQRIEIEREEFKQRQEIEKQKFFESERTEKAITDFQKIQQEERLKNEKELQIKLLEEILKGGRAKTKLEADLIKEQIKTLRNEIDSIGVEGDGTTPDDGGASIFSLLGLNLDPETEKAALDAIKKGGKAIIDELSKQAAERERIANEQIQASENELDRLNSQLDRELRLVENGFAANVALTQKNIEEQEKIRQQAIQDQRKAQQTQFAIDTATQTVNLVTASTEIFKNLSAGFPYTLPIAIASVAALFGAFIAARTQAAKAVGLADGGLIPIGRDDRTQTEQGYQIGNTGVYVGGGEYVMPYDQTQKYLPLLEAMRTGRTIDLGAVHSDKTRGFEAVVVANHKSDKEARQQLYKEAVKEAIQDQTGELGGLLRQMVNRPDRLVMDDGTILETYYDNNGNRRNRWIKRK